MLRGLRAIFQRNGLDREMRAEMDAHLARATERLIARGMSPDDARLEARREFGNLGVLQEEARDARGVRWVESLLGDVRFAIRHFSRRPLHSLTIVCVLSLGIGGHAAVFSMLQSMYVRPAPGVPDDASLVQIRGKKRPLEETKWQPRLLSHSEWRALAAARETFASVAAWRTRQAVIRVDGADVDEGLVRFVSDNYFSTLGVALVVGAGLPPTADAGAGEPVAIISNVLWQNSFAGTPDVVGKSITVNGMAVRVAGVAAAKFHGAFQATTPNVVWMQLPMVAPVMSMSGQNITSNDATPLEAVARLKPGVSREEASAIARVIGSRAIAERPQPSQKMAYDTDVASMSSANVLPQDGDMALIVILWTTIAMLVLLVACTNVSALVVGAAVARRHEIAVRLSLGASRARIVRQLVTETTILALAAGALGLTLFWWFATAVSRVSPELEMRPDARSIAFTLVVALGTGVLFGLSPALHATRRGLSDVLKDSGGGQASHSRLQRVFIVAQIALTQPLLVGLAMMLGLVPPETGVMANGVESRLISFRSNLNDRDGWERVKQGILAMPGVVDMMPDAGYPPPTKIVVHPDDRGSLPQSTVPFSAQLYASSPGYFGLLDIPMVRGRELLATDVSSGAVVIGSDLARTLWGAEDPIGKRFQVPDSSGIERGLTVIGVHDARYETTRVGGNPIYMLRGEEAPRGWLIRTAGPAAPMLDSVRSVIRATLATATIDGLETVAMSRAAIKNEAARISAATAGAGVLALLLASLGLYGVVTLAVGQRQREIGIRMALGAHAAQVVGMLFQSGIRLSAIGLMIGLPLSLVVLRLLADTIDLPEMSMPLIGAAIAFAVLGVAAFATWIPARRAATINPVTALRAE